MKKTTVGLLVAALALTLAAGALAHRRGFESRVTITENPAYSGAVHSQRVRCERGRKVKLLEETPQGSEIVGVTTTNVEGLWHIPAQTEGNRAYYAVVARKVFRVHNGKPHVCRADRSKTVHTQR
jgi:hypothetical protein